MNYLKCDFCNVVIENDGEGSAFCNGMAFTSPYASCEEVLSDDRIACPDCIEYLEEREEVNNET